MPKIKQRRQQADYIETAPGSENSAIALCGTGFKTLDEKPTAQTKSRRYINEKGNSNSVSGYDWSMAFDIDQILEQAAVEFIVKVAEEELIGEDAETNYYRVDLDKKNEDGSYHAKKRRVVVAVSDFTNDDGELGCTGNFLSAGDWVEGTFNIETKKFTEDAA